MKCHYGWSCLELLESRIQPDFALLAEKKGCKGIINVV